MLELHTELDGMAEDDDCAKATPLVRRITSEKRMLMDFR